MVVSVSQGEAGAASLRRLRVHGDQARGVGGREDGDQGH